MTVKLTQQQPVILTAGQFKEMQRRWPYNDNRRVQAHPILTICKPTRFQRLTAFAMVLANGCLN